MIEPAVWVPIVIGKASTDTDIAEPVEEVPAMDYCYTDFY